jgi:L-ascorbate metabolism protein UlaG (beta-lactamase superfamily)
MYKNNVKVNYLYNSSFKIETINHVLIFDYYNDSVESGIKNSSNGVIGKGDFENNKEVLVFCTHSHGDHFNKLIFDWAKINPNIKYILSSDIKVESCVADISKIDPYEKLQIKDVVVKAYGSTDIGISFLIKVDGITTFHAGDLNWWNWYDESDEANIKMEKFFKEEIDKLKGETIDIAFFPVDSRLKDSYSLGPDYFIDKIAPKIFIPMHFREDFSITKKFADKKRGISTKVLEITHRGEELTATLN